MSVFTLRLSGASAHLAHHLRLPLCSHILCFMVTDPRTSLYQTRRMCFWCVPCPRFLIRVVRNAQQVLGVCVLECLIKQPRLHLTSPCSETLLMPNPMLVEADLCRAVSQLCMQVAVVLVIMVSTERLLFATRKTPVFSRR